MTHLINLVMQPLDSGLKKWLEIEVYTFFYEKSTITCFWTHITFQIVKDQRYEQNMKNLICPFYTSLLSCGYSITMVILPNRLLHFWPRVDIFCDRIFIAIPNNNIP